MEDSLKEYQHLYRQIDDAYDRVMLLSGLPYYEFWSLYLIKEGKRTQIEIMQTLYSNKQTINSAIKNLCKKGLIGLQDDKSDKRKKVCSLTKQGEDFYKKFIGIVDDIEAQVWIKMSLVERNKLVSSTKTYLDLLKEESKKFLEEKK